MSAQKDAVDASAVLKADDTWQGDAAQSRTPGRQGSTRRRWRRWSRPTSQAMSSALDTVRAGDLVKFYMGLITALGALVAGIIAALAVHRPRSSASRPASSSRPVPHSSPSAPSSPAVSCSPERLHRRQQLPDPEDERQQRLPARGVAERSSGVSVPDSTVTGSTRTPPGAPSVLRIAAALVLAVVRWCRRADGARGPDAGQRRLGGGGLAGGCHRRRRGSRPRRRRLRGPAGRTPRRRAGCARPSSPAGSWCSGSCSAGSTPCPAVAGRRRRGAGLHRGRARSRAVVLALIGRRGSAGPG